MALYQIALIVAGLPVAVAAANANTAHHGISDTRLDWEQVESQASEHRQRVRMCGPLSAARWLRLLGHPVDVRPWLRRWASADPRGIPVREVLNLCREYEPDVHIVHLPSQQVRQLDLPCILLVNQGHHCLVAEAFDAERPHSIKVWDPSDLSGKRLSFEQLASIWSGDIIQRRRDLARRWMRKSCVAAGAFLICLAAWRAWCAPRREAS